MFVPFLSARSGSSKRRSSLERRKGGGGGGRGSTSSGSGRSVVVVEQFENSKSSKTSKTKIKYKSSSSSSTRWNKQVGVAAAIPAGYPFAGRIAGGGTRDNIYGSRTYGSGYPGIVGRGASGRGFPFFFWPLAWPLAVGGGAGVALYLHSNSEYGSSTNSTRPGGQMTYAVFSSASVAPNTPSTFRFLADNTTVALMDLEVKAECGSLLDSNATTSPLVFWESDTTPAPEQVVQYYRASSAVLTLDGYNNTATYAVEGTADSPLPDNH
ncbi:hypothetical protein FA13DRAFT_1765191 [Coprinellus micaceus]|uniref:Uncharacterized protein n=1 Tax=Coprinellus micaceus TaxID=71717 RepID=A0A4Y7T392_COPMI|nr:hypothetical protein FA13DRAFT_1765191 [Coprinellus micaceus]